MTRETKDCKAIRYTTDSHPLPPVISAYDHYVQTEEVDKSSRL